MRLLFRLFISRLLYFVYLFRLFLFSVCPYCFYFCKSMLSFSTLITIFSIHVCSMSLNSLTHTKTYTDPSHYLKTFLNLFYNVLLFWVMFFDDELCVLHICMHISSLKEYENKITFCHFVDIIDLSFC